MVEKRDTLIQDSRPCQKKSHRKGLKKRYKKCIEIDFSSTSGSIEESLEEEASKPIRWYFKVEAKFYSETSLP